MNGFLSRDFFTRNETLVALVIVAFCVLATISRPELPVDPTLTDLLRGGIVLGIFAVARDAGADLGRDRRELHRHRRLRPCT